MRGEGEGEGEGGVLHCTPLLNAFRLGRGRGEGESDEGGGEGGGESCLRTGGDAWIWCSCMEMNGDGL